jgi:hypothetical protein
VNRGRFRYAFEPVLLTRRWALDALLRTLAEHDAQIRTLAIAAAALQARYAQAAIVWNGGTGEVDAQPVQRFAMNVCYLVDLARQLREHAECMTALNVARDEVISSVVQARRALDAAEQHRAQMKGQFVQLRMSADFKLADDQWNAQQGAVIHGY